jgi:hypothetical protein
MSFFAGAQNDMWEGAQDDTGEPIRLLSSDELKEPQNVTGL